MSTQEEYLDNLLNDLTTEENLDSDPLDALDMSDMEKLLQSAAAAAEEMESALDGELADLDMLDPELINLESLNPDMMNLEDTDIFGQELIGSDNILDNNFDAIGMGDEESFEIESESVDTENIDTIQSDPELGSLDMDIPTLDVESMEADELSMNESDILSMLSGLDDISSEAGDNAEQDIEIVSEEMNYTDIDSFAIEDTANMSEDDIEKLLQAGQEEASGEVEKQEEQVLEGLDGTDEELAAFLDNITEENDISNINEDLSALGTDALLEGALSSAMAGEAVDSDDSLKKNEKQLQREAKKEAKKAAKDAKKAEKEAKKAEKMAKKAEKKGKGNNNKEVEADVVEIDGTEEHLSEVFDLESVTADVPMEDSAAVMEAALDDIVSMDFLNELMGEEKPIANTESASADSLAQVIEDKNKSSKEKKGLFARIVDFLTEEDEEEENEELKLSAENKKILKDMEKEKKKNRKGKKAKKGKEADQSEENAEQSEEDKEGQDKNKKGKKAKKEKKPKKEKEPKLVAAEGNNGKKLPKKPIVVISLMCVTIAAVIVVFSNLTADYSMKKNGRVAYYNGDYLACYQNLSGKKLNESEQVMFCKSEAILTIRTWLREYEILAKENNLEALDSLIQSVHNYPTLYEYSAQGNAKEDVAAIYSQLLSVLSEKYQLTEEQAIEIANTEDDIQYTKKVMAIVNGEGYGSWNRQENTKPQPLQHELPEESDISDTEFVDNKSAQ